MSALGPIPLRSPQTYSTRLYLRQEKNIWRFQARPPQNSHFFSSITWTLEKSGWHHQHYPPWWYSHCWCWLEDSPYWQCGKNRNKPSLNWGWRSIRCVMYLPLCSITEIRISGPQKVHENSPQPLLSEDPPSTTGRLGTEAHDGT